jgi:GPI-anchor transamidase subunit S
LSASLQIYHIIRQWIVRDYKIRSILGRIKTFEGKELRHTYPPPSPEYDILISVLNPRPDIQTLNWNVKKATEVYLQPFLHEFSNLSDFTLKSQWKYQVELKYASKQIKDDSKLGRHFALDYDALPHIITAIERKLGTAVANKPCIHLVIYAPPCSAAPVYIYKNNQRVSNFSFDSFVSAKWGGIVIANPSTTLCAISSDEKLISVNLNSHDIMDFVLYELRKIFELEIEMPIKDAAVVSLEKITPRLWEKDMYLRNGAIHLIASATSTLQSLVKLLNGIENIVISDLVAAEIHKAYENIVKAKIFLESNDVDNTVKHARIAYIAAERAFNDPSLLELLYFPQEQKYAIYIPLYLPIMIPVIFSMNALKKFCKKGKKRQVEDETVKEKSTEE